MIRRPPRSTPLSLHDALPIFAPASGAGLSSTALSSMTQTGVGIGTPAYMAPEQVRDAASVDGDRKSTRLNSSHQIISYAVFCLKKKRTHLTVPAAASAAATHG